ncbi:hypothetical protein ACP4OV_012437 [Aristida adscensionis]
MDLDQLHSGSWIWISDLGSGALPNRPISMQHQLIERKEIIKAKITSPPENKVMEQISGAYRSNWMAQSNHNIKCFTKGDIERITNMYATIIGRGGFGEVYAGVLEDQTMVAVKRFTQNVKENFGKELIVHREINHRNVVRLIGYCEEENAITMVTEYISNGNLSDVLHSDSTHIPLDVRLRIAVECAEALAYMHSHMYTRVIHGDIKPANILLDGSFNAKISDFGISRLVNNDKTLYTMNVIGSIGYMDPLFARDGCLTVKSDVYSFGVVLLELITRKMATATIQDREVNIVHQFTNALASGIRGVREMFDSKIASKNNMKILEGVAKLAGECLRMERDKRPEMIDVAERLRALKKASHQHEGQQRADLFSWVWKSKPAPPVALTVPDNILSPTEMCRQFSFEEIKAATWNLHKSLLVGQGRFGEVYRGRIVGATTEVVLEYCSLPTYRRQEILTQMEAMSWLRHDNVVQLIGTCQTENAVIFAYEYMGRGDLCKNLCRTREQRPLSWKQRMEICIGVARALLYLHGEHIIHGDLKTTDILLDQECVAKISFFVPECHVALPSNEGVPLVYGSVDIEFFRYNVTTDIYSFGVVLLEVLCDRPQPMENVSLVDWALRFKKEGNLDEIVDPYLKGKINPQCFSKFTETAEKCLALKRVDRPTMRQVLSELEHALQLQTTAEVSGS